MKTEESITGKSLLQGICDQFKSVRDRRELSNVEISFEEAMKNKLHFSAVERLHNPA